MKGAYDAHTRKQVKRVVLLIVDVREYIEKGVKIAKFGVKEKKSMIFNP